MSFLPETTAIIAFKYCSSLFFPRLFQQNYSSICLWVTRKPAVCFVLHVLYPEPLKCVWHFLFQVYADELDQHIIKPAYLDNIFLNRVFIRDRNMSSMQNEKRKRRKSSEAARRRNNVRATGRLDWSPCKTAVMMCPNEKHPGLFSSSSLPWSEALHENSLQREWKIFSCKHVGFHVPEGKCSGHWDSECLHFYSHIL